MIVIENLPWKMRSVIKGIINDKLFLFIPMESDIPLRKEMEDKRIHGKGFSKFFEPQLIGIYI